MQFEGDKDFPLPPDQVWPRISDARFLVDSLKDPGQLLLRGLDVGEWRVKPAASFISGTIDNRLEITNRKPPEEMTVVLTGKGVGSSSTTVIVFKVLPHEGGTRIHWQAEITQLTGLLKMIPKGLIQATAKKVIEDVWDGVEQQLKRV
ncbi:MAG TPA: SRPBCC domain-containing protein [Gemmataceae bacterium]|nr:SRPBCC domain-containing protein [Gemmataceae bacterium]